MEEIYLAGGCLWGVQEYLRHVPGIQFTEVGRANGTSQQLEGGYDGYAECVRTQFDPSIISLEQLIACYFEVIDPYSINKQGIDVGEKYRTGIYSISLLHLADVNEIISSRSDHEKIAVEVLPLTNYIKSADEHQDRLQNFPNDYCHIPKEKIYKYKDVEIE
ncbi:peptide-methionine (S)-S-oxide reductase [uncultured Psychromonas sp.]|uniref:peptide-methionine (S)-S-oxide reductase n=1 Tax=uncultured Psychromonas sp. TaxID=173974 RepID=UPI00261A6732|nr:peptide-methionine (S)-S-oxide reductase [uncultured Psychromonas sp.]